MADVAMPRLSDSMEEGTILKWLKSDGDEVSRGDEIVEIETDKANMTYEADQDGTLSIVAQEGDTLAVGETIARIGEGGSENGAAPAEREAEAGGERGRRRERDRHRDRRGRGAAGAARRGAGAGTRGGARRDRGRQRPDQGIAGRTPHGARARARARRPAGHRAGRADRQGRRRGRVEGRRPAGRRAGGGARAPSRSRRRRSARRRRRSSPGDSQTGKGETSTQDLTRLQQTVARRMAESKATAPEFVLNIDVDMDEAVDLRKRLKGAAAEGQPVPSFNDFVVKASALALVDFPRANGAYRDGKFELYSRVNVGVAVAGQDALVVPTVFDADTKSLGQISRETRALAERVRAGAITPPELSSGTFTVSNLGMFGIQSFVAVINPPQAAILAVGAMAPTPVVRDGEVVVRNIMRLTLACDHRILYGADAAEFLGRIRERLENPLQLAL